MCLNSAEPIHHFVKFEAREAMGRYKASRANMPHEGSECSISEDYILYIIKQGKSIGENG